MPLFNLFYLIEEKKWFVKKVVFCSHWVSYCNWLRRQTKNKSKTLKQINYGEGGGILGARVTSVFDDNLGVLPF